MDKTSYIDDDELINIAKEILDVFPIKPNSPDKLFPMQSKEKFSEYWQVREFLEYKNWSEITLEKLRSEYNGDERAILAFLSPEGFAYYLPGFLILATKIFKVDPELVDSIAFYLTPSKSNELSQRESERFRCFTKKQCSAIRRWLKYFQKIQSDYPICVDNALNRYWLNA
jgi:hypothetical protein